MLRDARTIADLYLESAAAAAASIIPKSPAQQSAVVSGQIPAAGVPSGGGILATKPLPQANEEPKKEEKQLPVKHWVKVEKVVKDDVKDVENLAHEIVMLIHSCCDSSDVTSKVMSKIFKKHRAWTKKK